MKTQQHNMDARQRYEVTAMVIPPQQHPPTNEQAALDYAGENFHHVEGHRAPTQFIIN